MVLAIDVYYIENRAKAVGMLFNWNDSVPAKIIIEHFTGVAEYIPGEFYKRELPGIEKVLNNVNINELELIIVDGYVYINNAGDVGLGGKLYENLNKQVPVVGVAKTSFFANKETVVEVKRGESNNPLYVSAIGVDVAQIATLVANMHGGFRMPTLLKLLDCETKANLF